MRHHECFTTTNAAAPQAAHERDAALERIGNGAREFGRACRYSRKSGVRGKLKPGYVLRAVNAALKA
jgi:hypothetical protein